MDTLIFPRKHDEIHEFEVDNIFLTAASHYSSIRSSNKSNWNNSNNQELKEFISYITNSTITSVTPATLDDHECTSGNSTNTDWSLRRKIFRKNFAKLVAAREMSFEKSQNVDIGWSSIDVGKKSSKISILRFERGTKSIFDPTNVENVSFALRKRYQLDF